MNEIKDASYNDLKKIARCHALCFKQSVTVKLGQDFIENMMKWYLSAPNKFLYFIEENGQCVGYCGGFIMDGSDDYGSTSGMTQFGFGAAVKSLLLKPWLLFHPEIRSRYPFIITNVKRKFKKFFQKDTKPTDKKTAVTGKQKPLVITAGLVVIGVSPEKQGAGIGSILIKEFERRARAMGASAMQLSVRKNNDQAIRAYERNGWKIEGEHGASYIMTKIIA